MEGARRPRLRSRALCDRSRDAAASAHPQAISERDAVSLLTLLAQQLWEKERQYKPQRPAPVTVPPVNLEAVVAAKAEAS